MRLMGGAIHHVGREVLLLVTVKAGSFPAISEEGVAAAAAAAAAAAVAAVAAPTKTAVHLMALLPPVLRH